MANKVWLIGAGCGDEELLTIKALRYLQNADVVIYDNLINSNILTHCKASAEKIYVGKKANNHTLSQDEINKLLIEKALCNDLVVRLKGGDPYVFGRGGEEAIALMEANIPFGEIPGISSSIAGLAYAGIPVTHRGIASSFSVITGHEDPTKSQSSINYKSLAMNEGTLIFLMGLNNIRVIASKLIQNGKCPKTPAAIVSNACTSLQKVVIGTLDNIENKAVDLAYPAIIVVGDVVHLRSYLNWYEKQPLFGKKILVTRTRQQASVLSQKILELGGEPIEFPTIQIVPNDDESLLNNMFYSLNTFNWLIFTSVNAVELFFNAMKNRHIDLRELYNIKICAIGKATKQAIEDFYINVECCPDEYIAEELVKCLKDVVKKGDNILIPRSEQARDVLPKSLSNIGANIHLVPLYKTVVPEVSRESLINVLSKINIITFSSSSTVSNFVKILGSENFDLLQDKEIVCIGPITADTAIKSGINVDKIADEYTIDGLVVKLTEKNSELNS